MTCHVSLSTGITEDLALIRHVKGQLFVCPLHETRCLEVCFTFLHVKSTCKKQLQRVANAGLVFAFSLSVFPVTTTQQSRDNQVSLKTDLSQL